MTTRRTPLSRRGPAGFTLVELMVALAVSFIVLLGVGQVFLNSKRGAALQEEQAAMQGNGRFALHTLRSEILKAGYLGCGHMTVLADSIYTTGSYEDSFGSPLTGYESLDGGWSPALPAEIDDPATSDDDVRPGTDVITLRYGAGEGLRMLQPKQHYFFKVRNLSQESDGCGPGSDSYSGICPGDLMIVSDCSKARTFTVQDMHLASGELEIYHPNPAWGDPGDPNPNNHFNPAYSYLFEGVTVSYFVRERDPDSGVPVLYRKMGGGPAEELVEGVENLQLLYGLDSDDDGIPNQFLRADGITDFRRVVSVRLALLVRSITERTRRPAATRSFTLLDTTVTTPSDRHLRKVFDTTIQLRNSH